MLEPQRVPAGERVGAGAVRADIGGGVGAVDSTAVMPDATRAEAAQPRRTR
ncbi:hypothetical protein [Nocardia farcinica]|uniref:hypothetical protein n=1 Tax=Nocardia farcinica TaxID=37329 RepID=UPI00138B0A03|nr:hypothetical protein [Nocardia farcinica]MBF6232761.1 hypothetical protein [Nocardia farcinica]MBF6266297.1 hypothetical protein [Nocardia farcinica]MBF6506123.1 hypothetical protein [Nocardia farcinica]MCZ9325379.1 hypothetical protein [Nocardia farcinica]